MKKLLLALSVLLSYQVQAQKAKEYYTLLLKADDMIIENKLDSAVFYYNEAFEKYNYPFYAHIKRAAIIANFNDDSKLLKQLLVKCIQKGMPKFQFKYFQELGLNKKVVKEVELDYDIHYNTYLENVDTSIVFKYLDLDARDLLLHKYLYSYSKDSLKDAYYAKFQEEASIEFQSLIDKVGYPSEANIGLPKIWEFELGKKKKLKKNKWNTFQEEQEIKFIDSREIYFMGYQESPHYLNHSNFPGGWFYWHYPAAYYGDTLLFTYLEQGFENLELNQMYIGHYFDSKHDSKTDFCTTYYSDIYQTKYRSWAGIFNRSTKEERFLINNLRAKYYIQSIDKQEQLIKALYKLRYGSDKKITNKMIKKIEYEYIAFILCYKM